MSDFVLLIACTYLIILFTNKKSITKRICSLVLLVFFASMLFFSTNDALISSLASKLIGEKEHTILKEALTNANAVFYAGNSVWIFYKLYLILSVLFYGCLYLVKSFKKIFVIAIFNFKNFVSSKRNIKLPQSKEIFNSKMFLFFGKLIN